MSKTLTFSLLYNLASLREFKAMAFQSDIKTCIYELNSVHLLFLFALFIDNSNVQRVIKLAFEAGNYFDGVIITQKAKPNF